MAAKKRGAAGKAGGAGSKIWAVVVVILTIALALSFMRANGITDVNGAMHYFRGISADASKVYDRKIKDAVDRSCNFVKNPGCLLDKSSQAKIGDVNHDGRIDDLDSEAYAKENGVTLPSGTSSKPDDEGTSATGSKFRDSDESVNRTTGSKDVDEILSRLEGLTVAEPDQSSKYSRSDYKHWIKIDGACDAREYSLKMAGYDVDSKTCKPKAGFSYLDPYTGKTVTDPKALDIDHVIPLGYVNAHGGAKWSAEKKKQYANDVKTVLLPVDASANRQKGDKGPAAWMPSNKTFTCQYAKKWVEIASKYGISVTQADKKVLKTSIQSCDVN